jgi:hypothetical protein
MRHRRGTAQSSARSLTVQRKRDAPNGLTTPATFCRLKDEGPDRLGKLASNDCVIRGFRVWFCVGSARGNLCHPWIVS